jgi:hypothetical protein
MAGRTPAEALSNFLTREAHQQPPNPVMEEKTCPNENRLDCKIDLYVLDGKMGWDLRYKCSTTNLSAYVYYASHDTRQGRPEQIIFSVFPEDVDDTIDPIPRVCPGDIVLLHRQYRTVQHLKVTQMQMLPGEIMGSSPRLLLKVSTMSPDDTWLCLQRPELVAGALHDDINDPSNQATWETEKE